MYHVSAQGVDEHMINVHYIIKKAAHGATYRQKGLELPALAGLVPAPLGVEVEGRPAVRLHVRGGGPSANSQSLVSRQHRF